MRALAFSLFACLLAAPTFAQSSAPAAAQVQANMQINMVSAGDGATRTLRYDFDAFTAQRSTIDMDMTMAMSMGGMQMFSMPVPTMRSVYSVGTPTVDDAGNATLTFEMEQLEIVGDTSGADPAVVQAMSAALGEVSGLSGSMTLDPQGRLVDSSYDLSNASPTMRQQLESMLKAAEQAVVPFPNEPVGQGAQWNVDMEVDAGGMTVSQTVTYELVEISDDGVRIRTVTTQTANAQTLQLPDLPPGAAAELVAHSASGTGDMRIRFARPLPEGTMSMAVETTMAVSEPGGPANNLVTSITMGISMADAP